MKRFFTYKGRKFVLHGDLKWQPLPPTHRENNLWKTVLIWSKCSLPEAAFLSFVAEWKAHVPEILLNDNSSLEKWMSTLKKDRGEVEPPQYIFKEDNWR